MKLLGQLTFLGEGTGGLLEPSDRGGGGLGGGVRVFVSSTTWHKIHAHVTQDLIGDMQYITKMLGLFQ